MPTAKAKGDIGMKEEEEEEKEGELDENTEENTMKCLYGPSALRNCLGVTGQNIPLPEYTRLYYGLGQFIPRDIFKDFGLNRSPLPSLICN